MKTKLLILLLAVSNLSLAQTAATNTGILYLSSGSDILYAASDFTNNSGAALTNNGQLYIRGNLSNGQSSMTIGTGTLYLNGSAAQTVGGAQPFRTFNLNTNNTAGITLNSNLSVSGVHTFAGGLISTSSTPNYLVYEAGSSYAGNNDSRHVNGWVKKFGSTDFTFPVGDATYQRTAAVTNLSAASEVDCRYYRTTQNIYSLFSPLVSADSAEYWDINRLSGGTFKVALNWDHSKVPFYNVLTGDVHGANYTGGLWRSIGGTPAGSPATTGTLTLTNDIGLGSNPITFGFTSWPLPLRIVRFSVERRSGTSYLYWATENAAELDHFEVERSHDGTTFVMIGQVAAKNSFAVESYNFDDREAVKGMVYYRIRLVDRHGKYSFTKIVVVAEKEINAGGVIALNPARSAITLFNKTGIEGSFAYRLYDAGGRILLTGQVNMEANAGTIIRLPHSIRSGICLLELNNGSKKYTQKILIDN